MKYDIIFSLIVLIMVVVLWPILKWVAIILLCVFAVFIIKVLIESRRLKKEIQKNPQAYYNKNNGNVIDAEYSEKEVEEVK
ncbi:MAG: hypothetical protein Q4C64_07445 [Erysipelotrichia bacterium]|nr:hypothetical protein [Erysipelotrichia bacterium]